MPGGKTALKQTALPLANPNPHPVRRDRGSVCLCSDFSPGTNGTSAHSRISSACGSPYGFQASSGTARIAPWSASLIRALIPQSGRNPWGPPARFSSRSQFTNPLSWQAEFFGQL